MAGNPLFETTIDATLPAVGELLNGLAARLAELSFDQSTRHAVMLCTEEIAVNALLHGGIEGQRQSIAVRLTSVPEAVIAEISYPGPRFDPVARAPSRRPGFDHVGGRGLYLVQQKSSDVRYAHDAGCNTVTIRIARSPD